MEVNHTFSIVILLLIAVFCDIAMQEEAGETKLGTVLHFKFEDENVTTVFNQCCANDEIFDIIKKRCMTEKNGTNSIWLMNGDGTHDDIINPGSFGSAWDVAGVADFNADGLTDILWRHDNGANRIWLMDDDSTRAQNLNPGAFGSAWDIVGM